MPYIETVEELAEALADLCGIYRSGIHFVGYTPEASRSMAGIGDMEYDHAPSCQCRQCWAGHMEQRIRNAVANEQRLTAADTSRR